jgi:hypothetical protein
MTEQTEIPVEIGEHSPIASPDAITEAPVKKAAGRVTKTPSQEQENTKNPYQFTVLAALPYRTFDPMCCTRFSAEVWRGIEDDDVYVTYYHASDCEVWRFV